jgi:hypothetical protein
MAVESQHSVCILPWLGLRAPLTFGALELAPAPGVVGRIDPDLQGTVTAILAAYRRLGHRPATPVLAWSTGTEPTEPIADDDLDRFWRHARLLALAAIAENQYFKPLSAPITAGSFQLYFQYFTPDAEHTAVACRRRDGRTLSSWPLDRVTYTAPLSASEVHPNWDDAFLAAMGSVAVGTTELDERISLSADAFFDANRLEDHTSADREVVWSISALEQLLGVWGAGSLGQQLAALFADSPSTQTTWTDWRGRSRSGTWLESWLAEAYEVRSAIHGTRPAREVWQAWEHALIATVVYELAVKLLLVDAGRYEPTDRDRDELGALNERIAGGTPVQEHWDTAYEIARWNRVGANAAEHLSKMLGEDDPPQSSGQVGP